MRLAHRSRASIGWTGVKRRVEVPNLTRKVVLFANSAQYIAVALENVQANDMIGALRQFEMALDDPDLPLETRKKLLYNTCAIHAGFGDAELAKAAELQVPLREAVALGLDFEATVQAPGEGMIPMKSSQQVIISLKKFAKTCKSGEPRERAAYNPAKGLTLTPSGVRTAFSQEDIQDMIGTEIKGEDMDKSLAGILKRVAILVFTLIALGLTLFFVGLEFMFPDGI